MNDFKVTPWEVTGDIDYDELIVRFGTKRVDDELLARFEKYGPLHPLLRRGIVYSQRDMEWILDQYDRGNKFFLYTGRGPSGHIHLGHLMPWIFTKYLQDTFGANLYFQMTDDEKFLFNDRLTLKETKAMAYENALDVIALGFDPKKTKIIVDTECIKTLYPMALEVAKRVTFSTARAVFGFENDNNLGEIFYTSVQAAPCFMEKILYDRDTPCVIPCGIDQDAHFRVTRDVAPLLGLPKPALLHTKMFPGLTGGDKMSSSVPGSTIYTLDTPKEIKKKIGNAFTGGAVTVEEQRRNGGRPEVCSVFKYNFYLFEEDDRAVDDLADRCRKGEILCGECKKTLTERIIKFLDAHQERREAAKDRLDDFMLRERC
ncbi:MAG: tryptophan--tRNA ligase [Methanomassiliicoccales archaeon]|nr:MAG: tryptophan--tRNA ligase [Methanomassiliicoccales archaeon]